MSYRTNSGATLRIPTDSKRSKEIATFGDALSNVQRPQQEFHEFEPAEVIDIILNEDHPDFRSREDIGAVKIRYLHSEYNKDESKLQYARPFRNNISMYPLIHEIVLVGRFMGYRYYLDILNRQNNVNHNHNAFASIDVKEQKEFSEGDKNDVYDDAEFGITNVSSTDSSNIILGNTFEINDEIKPLEHDEGDLILEGRFGNSIRLGSNQENAEPVIMMRVGQNPEKDEEPRIKPIREDFNQDGTSFYLTEDKEIEIDFATEDLDMHLRSIDNFPDQFNGRQILANSDRIVLNAKEDEIFAFAANKIAFTTGNTFTVDSLHNIEMTTRASKRTEIDVDEINTIGDFVSWNVPKMYLGEDQNEDNPLVLGQEYLELLSDILSFFRDQYIMVTPVGPTDPGSTPSTPQLNALINRIEDTLSERNFTM